MPKTNPTLTITPNPIPVGTQGIVISGTGYRAGQHIQVITSRKSGWATADDDGNFSINYEYAFNVTESAAMQAWDADRPRMLAEARYTVE